MNISGLVALVVSFKWPCGDPNINCIRPYSGRDLDSKDIFDRFDDNLQQTFLTCPKKTSE